MFFCQLIVAWQIGNANSSDVRCLDSAHHANRFIVEVNVTVRINDHGDFGTPASAQADVEPFADSHVPTSSIIRLTTSA